MSVFIAKDLGLQVVSNLDFMARPGIYWRWCSAIFSGHSFGTAFGPKHCFFQAGFHDFAHCIDFIMRGKQDRVTSNGLNFHTPWQFVNPVFGHMDGEPKTSQITRCEARVFALQAYFMNREMGFIIDSLDYDDERTLREAGKLSHLREKSQEESVEWNRSYSLIQAVSIEEYARDKGELEFIKWKDSEVFLSEYGFGYSSGLSYKERSGRWRECFVNLIIEEYNRFQNPFVEKRISRAVTALGERLRRFHKTHGFVPTDDHFGIRHAGIDTQKPASTTIILEAYNA